MAENSAVLLLSFLFFIFVQFGIADDTIIIPPMSGSVGNSVALIFIHGAQVQNKAYLTLFAEVQKQASRNKLWILLPGFTLDMPSPLQVKATVTDALKNAQSQGLPVDAPVFYSGHSLGSIIAQDYLFNSTDVKAAGLILTGGYLKRQYLVPSFQYKVPTLTIGGELDGLSRVTRIVESFYQQITKLGKASFFPVVVLPGVSHWQFAGEGSIPIFVKVRDLIPEAIQTVAWQQIAALFSDFISFILLQSKGEVVASGVASTATFAAPIIAAFELEGSRHFNAPNQIGGWGESTCIKGACSDHSNWAPNAQALIDADIPGWTVKISNQYVHLSAMPITGEEFHHPTVTPDPATHTIFATTLSQCFWDKLEDEDTGFSSLSANEIATKMYSRQCTLIHGAGYPNTTSFSVDDPNFCSISNEQSYKWAMLNAGTNTLNRFLKIGKQYVFGDDKEESAGPLWINGKLQYNEITVSGSKVIQIISPMLKTDINYWDSHFHIPRPASIPDPGCYHYCKLLSPARVMEWIYVDSLRV